MDFKVFIEHITKIYNKLSKAQRIIIGLAIAVLVAFFVFLIIFANKKADSAYAVLFEKLDSSDSALILQYLKDNQIPYKIPRNDVIEIPTHKVAEERIALAAQGIPKTSKVGFEIFDINNIAETDFTQQVKFLRATEGELTRTIEALEPILKANVQIASPKESLFVSTATPPTAAIMVQIRPGSSLSHFQITGIKNLVSAAIPKLTPENVKIVDGNGIPLGEEDEINGANEVLKQQYAFVHKEEQRKANDIVKLLAPRAGGANKVVAIVHLQYDFNQQESVKQTFDGSQVFPRSQKDYEKIERGPGEKKIGGIPGVESNVGPVQNLDSENSNTFKQETETIINNEIGNETIKTKFSIGKPIRLTASVLVNGERRLVRQENGEEKYEYVPLTEQEIEKLENLVKNAIGFNAERGDSVTVSDWDFSRSESVAPQTFADKASKVLSQYMPILKYLLIAVIIFIFYKKVIAPFAERMLEIQDTEDDKVESLFEIDDDDDDEEASRFGEMRKRIESQLGLSDGFSEDEVKYEVVLEKIRSIIQEKPDEIASLFQKLVYDEIGMEKSS